MSDNANGLLPSWITLKPEQFTVNSNKKVWWRCSAGHEWQATIGSRNTGAGCPYCSCLFTSKGVNDLQTVNPTLANEWNYEKNGDLTPERFTANSGKIVWWRCKKGHEWKSSIIHRNQGTSCPYCSGKMVLKGYNDLQTTSPYIANEWNYEKNGEVTPDHFTAYSNKTVWWKCKRGHEWQAQISNRSNGRGCPICNSERNTSFPEYAIIYYLKKYNLDAIHSFKEYGFELDIYIPAQQIAIEFDGYYWHKNRVQKDLDKNCKCKRAGIKLYRIREGLPALNDSSIDYVIQKDDKDLPQTIESILSLIVGASVDVDLNRDAIAIENLRDYTAKENSLLLSNQRLAEEWNYEKNGEVKPEHFSANSHKNVWWKCRKGHEWEASIHNRNKGRSCPYCSGKKVLKGFNDMQTVNPVLAKEWNYEKNGGLKPEHFTANSHRKVWWKCSKGHEWEATISHRNNGRGCPFCSGKKTLEGYNDLQTVNPALAKEWNYEKNGDLKPEQFTANSDKKVWWKCSKGHEWEATIGHRNRGTNCPFCSSIKAGKDNYNL